MQQIDELAIHSIGIPRLLLMEHAGLAVARVVREMLSPSQQEVLVCCGMGYNGGDGLCAARHLLQWDYRLSVILVGSIKRLSEEPATYAKILTSLDVPIQELESHDDLSPVREQLTRADLIVDALLGIGLRGPMRPLYGRLITLMNEAHKRIVSVDVPSGLDADSGLPHGVAVHATVTVTFGLPKQGLLCAEGPGHAGRVIVDDISIPGRLLNMATP